MGLVLSPTAGRWSRDSATWSTRSPASDVSVGIAGGPRTDGSGRAHRRSRRRIRSRSRGADGVLVLLDLGSAALSLELALEDLDPPDRAPGPGQRGAARRGRDPRRRPGEHRRDSLDEVEAAAAGGATMAKIPRA